MDHFFISALEVNLFPCVHMYHFPKNDIIRIQLDTLASRNWQVKTQNLHTSRVNIKPEVSSVDSYSSLISVSKARRILGTLSDSMTDDQVIELIHCLHLLAREQLCYNGSKISGITNNEHTI